MDSSKLLRGLKPLSASLEEVEENRDEEQGEEDAKIIFIGWTLGQDLDPVDRHHYLEHLVYRLLPSDSHDRCIAYGFSNHVAPLVERGRFGSRLSFFPSRSRQFQASDGDLADLPRTISPSLSGLLPFFKYGLFK